MKTAKAALPRMAAVSELRRSKSAKIIRRVGGALIKSVFLIGFSFIIL